MVEHLTTPTPEELDALTVLWEASVRATHDFLASEDIPFFRRTVRRDALPAAALYVIRECAAGEPGGKAGKSGGASGIANRKSAGTGAANPGNSHREAGGIGGFAAFAGVAGEMLEMLFVDPAMRGKGLGRRLVEYTIRHCGVRRVDVNEQNPQAVGFYKRLGFRTSGRDAADPSGRPYPILHMELGHAPHKGLVPIPILQIDRIDIDFQREATDTDSEKDA